MDFVNNLNAVVGEYIHLFNQQIGQFEGQHIRFCNRVNDFLSAALAGLFFSLQLCLGGDSSIPLWTPCERRSPGRRHRWGRRQEILPPPHYCRISVVHFFFLQSRKKKTPSKPCGSKGAFGGDCWTRTSDLLRVKQAL